MFAKPSVLRILPSESNPRQNAKSKIKECAHEPPTELHHRLRRSDFSVFFGAASTSHSGDRYKPI